MQYNLNNTLLETKAIMYKYDREYLIFCMIHYDYW